MSYSLEWRTFRDWSTMPIGVVALSYAKRAAYEEPNPVNYKLAKFTERLVKSLSPKHKLIVVAQWEIAKQLKQDGQPADLIVTNDDATVKPSGRRYLDSADVLNKAYELFRENSITDVIVIANPFLHLQAAQGMVDNEGFTVRRFKVPRVGFDPSHRNVQWWCRGPIRFVFYLGLQVIGKLIHRDFHGIGEKTPT